MGSSAVLGDWAIGAQGKGIAAATGALGQGIDEAKPAAHQVFGVVNYQVLEQI